MSMNFAKSISKNLSGKDSPGMLAMHQKLLDYAKQYATDTFKTASKRAIQKTAEVTDDLIGNKIANKITKIWIAAQQIIQRMINKNLKKDKYLQRKDRKLLINSD